MNPSNNQARPDDTVKATQNSDPEDEGNKSITGLTPNINIESGLPILTLILCSPINDTWPKLNNRMSKQVDCLHACPLYLLTDQFDLPFESHSSFKLNRLAVCDPISNMEISGSN